LKLGDSVWRIKGEKIKRSKEKEKTQSFYYLKNNGTEWARQRLEMPLLHNNNRGRDNCACA